MNNKLIKTKSFYVSADRTAGGKDGSVNWKAITGKWTMLGRTDKRVEFFADGTAAWDSGKYAGDWRRVDARNLRVNYPEQSMREVWRIKVLSRNFLTIGYDGHADSEWKRD